LFTQMQLEPTDWLRLNGGLRYQQYWLKDHQTGPYYHSSLLERDENAFSFSVGATVMPADGWQVFATYKQASRLPSLMEATAGFFMVVNPDLHGEEAHNWEVGANYTRANLFSADDELGLKLVWFDNDIQDYIARRYIRSKFSMQMYNIDRAQFSGLEASATYRIGSLNIDAGATWYDTVSFCRPGEACLSSTLASDYATNYIPPEFAANLSVSRDFFGDRLNLGARLVYRGERAADFEPTDNGYAPLLAAVPWKAYTAADLTGRYRLGEGLTLDWSVENLTDQYYVEPLSLGVIPAPGRTFRIGLTGQIGSGGFNWPGKWFGSQGNEEAVDWSGPYVGLTLGHGFGREKGMIADLSGASADGGVVNERLQNAVGGFLGGMNWQLANKVVVGVEADIMTGALGAGSSVVVADPNSNLSFYKRLESSVDYSWDGFASLRGRVGYSFGRSLVYATGGPAWLRETQTRTQFRSDQGGNNVDVFFSETSKVDRNGWSLGGGVERAIGQSWSLRAEYLYADFGKGEFKFDRARAGVGRSTQVYEFQLDPITGDFVLDENGWPIGSFVTKTGSSEITNGRKARTDAEMHTLRIGLSYRF
ncbi:MAG: TonB-dependent receptor domain-containing protein, partial [Brevundimonas sp.]